VNHCTSMSDLLLSASGLGFLSQAYILSRCSLFAYSFLQAWVSDRLSMILGFESGTRKAERQNDAPTCQFMHASLACESSQARLRTTSFPCPLVPGRTRPSYAPTLWASWATPRYAHSYLTEHRVRCHVWEATVARMALPISFPLEDLAVTNCDLGRTDMVPDTKQEVRQLGDDFIERRKNPPPRSAATGKKGGAGGSAGGGLQGQAKGGASTSAVRGAQVSRPLMSFSRTWSRGVALFIPETATWS
jgi:hypothetical protein